MVKRSIVSLVLAAGLVAAFAGCGAGVSAADPTVALADPTADMPLSPAADVQHVVFAGGCFWGVQAVFQHVKGVRTAVSGYSGGNATTAHYEEVSTGRTGHAESVDVTYDASQVSFGQLLKVFFSVAHDPTEKDRQGPDTGTQYRSAIFTTTDEQKRVADAYVHQLADAHAFSGAIVTEIVPLAGFYPAEEYHQDYATRHPDNPYIRTYDAPKVANLKTQFPDLYTQNPER